MQDIRDIAKKLGLSDEDIETYGRYKAKVNLKEGKKNGKLILVTAINPTKYGEGKTTISIGLADAMNSLGFNTSLALREPSLGPVFGIKGGATGGGKAKLQPSDDINLHFTGDFHAITSANNLLCALIDNHIYQGNSLNIDENNILFHRCLDISDRALRQITISQEKLARNVERKEGFAITAASEVMAILCLANDLDDLKKRLGNIMVAFSKDGEPIYARDLKTDEAMTILLKDAIRPNLVQTEEGTPALVHGGPFANIAHGCNSVIATKLALSHSDYVVTEAGFGGDLGGEKFIDLKCRLNNLNPSAVVLVATIRALKSHSEDENSLEKGLENLEKHIENFTKVFNKEVIVAINKFDDDSEKDIEEVKAFCQSKKVEAIVANPFADGAKGTLELAKAVTKLCENSSPLKFAYNLQDNLEKKITDLAKNIYGAVAVEFSSKAQENIKKYQKFDKNMPIIVAKTQYSLSDDERLKGAPRDYTFHVRDIELKSGAGFILVIADNIMLMPGLPKEPNSAKMTIDSHGKIENLV